jgi:hypothetical protein
VKYYDLIFSSCCDLKQVFPQINHVVLQSRELYEVLSNIIFFRFSSINYYRKKCKIGPCGWPKLQITPCVIRKNSKVLVVG